MDEPTDKRTNKQMNARVSERGGVSMLTQALPCAYSRGHVLLIGPIGSQLSDLAALVLFMLEYPIDPVDCSYQNTFLDGLRSAVRRAGCDGKTTTLVMTVRTNHLLGITGVYIKYR